MKKGLTLIELAIVLVIAGILLSFSVRSCIFTLETAKIDKTKDILSNCRSKFLEKTCRNLIIKLENCQHKDAWGDTINIYIPDSIKNKRVCSLTKTDFSLKINSETYNNTAVLFLSLGENKKLDSNITNSTAEIKGDDIAEFITLKQLKASCCEGENLRIVTKEIPPIVEGEDYETGILVKGGSPPYTCSFKVGNFTFETSANSTCYMKIPYQEVDEIANSFSSQGYAPLDVTVTDSYGISTSKEFRTAVIRRF